MSKVGWVAASVGGWVGLGGVGGGWACMGSNSSATLDSPRTEWGWVGLGGVGWGWAGGLGMRWSPIKVLVQRNKIPLKCSSN